jgi:acyl-coenzyme A thioesterase PaaI-like protein
MATLSFPLPPVEHYRATVKPELTTNLYLDYTLGVKRGPDGVEMQPEACMTCSKDGYLHFSIATTLGEEAAWWAVGDEHAVPANVSVQLMRPAHVAKGKLIARGTVLRLGKNVMCSEAEVVQDMKVIAKVTFVHFEKR